MSWTDKCTLRWAFHNLVLMLKYQQVEEIDRIEYGNVKSKIHDDPRDDHWQYKRYDMDPAGRLNYYEVQTSRPKTGRRYRR